MARTTARHGAPVAEMSLSAGLAGAAFGVAALVGVFAVCDAGFGGPWRWHLAAGSAAASTVIAAVGAWHRRDAISVGGSAHAAGVCALACALNSAYHVVLTADPLATGPLLLTVLASGVVLPLARWLLVVDVVAVVGYVPTAVLHTDVVGWTEIGVSLAMAIGGSHVLHTLRARGHAQLQALTDALAEQATRDQLTGLLNRRGLAGICVDLAALPGRLGVVCLDVDGFKHINDELGHAAGDGVLVEIADRLSGIAGDDGVLVRLGGDESRCSCGPAGDRRAARPPGAHPIGRDGRRSRPPLGQPASAPPRAWWPPLQDVERLLAAADLAMYDDKQARRGLRGTAPGAAAPARAEVGGC